MPLCMCKGIYIHTHRSPTAGFTESKYLFISSWYMSTVWQDSQTYKRKLKTNFLSKKSMHALWYKEGFFSGEKSSTYNFFLCYVLLIHGFFSLQFYCFLFSPLLSFFIQFFFWLETLNFTCTA